MKQKVVLVYGFADRQAQVCSLIADCRVEARVVEPAQADETIGYLCGLSGARESGSTGEEKPLNLNILIFCGLTEKELNKVLAAIRGAALDFPVLKAMVTDTNRVWTLRALSKELQEEQRTMSALMELKRYRDSLPAPTVLNFKLMLALVQADQLLHGQGDVTIPNILQARKNLQDALENP